MMHKLAWASLDELYSWLPPLTWNKEHDSSSKGAIEPLKGWKVGKGKDSSNDSSEAWHGREDHEGTSCIPVGWRAKQGRTRYLKPK